MRKSLLLFLFACLAVMQVQAAQRYRYKLAGDTEWRGWYTASGGTGEAQNIGAFIGKENWKKLEVLAIKDNFEDYGAFTGSSDTDSDGHGYGYYIKTLDLTDWDSGVLNGSWYFGNGGHMSNLTTLILPNREIYINSDGYGAFMACSALTTIQVGANTDIKQIGSRAFESCTSLTNASVMTMFSKFTGTRISYSAFTGCSGITGTLTFPSTLESIGNRAFESCTGLERAIFSSSLTTIGTNAFYHCTSMTDATFQPAISTIGNSAFEGCTALTEVTFTGTDANKIQLSSLGTKAFKDCYELVNFYLQTETPNFTSMGDYCFERCHKLSTTAVNSYILPCFQGTTINQGVFRCCCTGLTAVTIPSTITTIQNKGFHGTNALASLTFADRSGTLTIADSRAFSPEPAEDGTYNAGTHSTTALTTVTFGNGTYSIGDAAFMKAYNLQTINVGASTVISRIGQCSFGDCRPLTSASVNALLSKAQSGLTVEHYAFYGCSRGNLKHIDIPATVTTLQSGCFGMSEKPSTIDNITVHSATPPTLDRSANTFAASGNSNYMTNGTHEIFRNVRPNYVTIYFKDAAATVSDGQGAFYSYMEDGSEWQRLLTKTLSSTNTTYDVYPQQHAIVKLTRPLKAGWNTLCLPFAVNYAIKELGGKRQNTEILKDALNAKNGSSFKLAVYRGYYKDNNLFRFLNYAKFNTDPIDAFEAFMVYMDEGDLAGDNVYTFTNVDLNYHYSSAAVNRNFDTANPGIYNGTDPSTGAKRGAVPLKEFNGHENTDVRPFNDGNSNYDDYVFRGSYVQIVESVSDNPTPVSQSPTGTITSVLKESHTGETAANLIDGKTSTKYCANKGSNGDAVAWIVNHLQAAKAVTAYSITSANDEQGRDPKNWKLQGSNDGNTWTDLDTQSGETFSARHETKKYMVYGGASYEYYRLYITDTYETDNTMIQLAEWTLEDTNLSVKDAFIQNTDKGTYFYHCKAGNKYGVRGFCGWFKYVGSGEEQAASARPSILAAFYDGFFDDEPTEIVALDSNGNEQPAYYDVYTLGGQQVRSHAASLAGLSKGLYIVNGKKVVVK